MIIPPSGGKTDALTRRLIEKVTVYDEKMAILFRSGLEIEIAA